MWTKERYVATRDPSRGGLHISATTEGFSKTNKEEIYDRCLELIAKDLGCVCTSIYPLSNGQYSVAMGYKVAGSARESRPHEVIRGVIADPEEVITICETYIAEGNAENLFFPSEPNPDRPEEWSIKEALNATASGRMNEFWRALDYRAVLGFFNAMKEVKRKKYKIRLIVPEGTEQLALAACCIMGIQARVRLFVMADGECTQTMPDLIITDKLVYLDEQQYRSMTLEQFIYMGSCADSGKEASEKSEKFDEVEKLLALCREYLVSEDISDYCLYQRVNEVITKDESAYSRFRAGLKNQLYNCKNADYYMERYMKLLYIAFKTTAVRTEGNLSAELCTAPYDFRGMYLLIEKKTKTKRELRRYLVAMLETQFSECGDSFSKKAIREAAMNVIENM